MQISQVIEKLENYAPPNIAQFDYVGFLVKTKRKEIKKIGLTLDATLQTIQGAIDQDCDLLITHHGPDDETFKNSSLLDKERLTLATQNDLPVYRMHLNLDFCSGGNSETLCQLLGFPNPSPSPIDYRQYHLAVGMHTVTGTFPLVDLIQRVQKLHPTSLRIVPSSKTTFKKVAISPGEGFKAEFFEQIPDIDCYISGELNHIAIVRAQDLDICLIEATHASTENEPLKIIAKKFESLLHLPVIYIDSSDNLQVISLP